MESPSGYTATVFRFTESCSLMASTFKTFVSASSPPSDSDLRNQSRGGLPRFFSDDLPSRKGGIVRVQGSEFWHMAKVLRLKPEDRVELFNGKGGLVEGCIQSIDKTGVDFIAQEDQKLILPQGIQWHVFAVFGTLKGGRADWLIEECTELGASSVTPLLTERSSIISENRVDRLERVSFAAAKQCQRLHQMALNPPIKFGALLDHISKSKLCLVATAEATPLLNAVSTSAKESSGLLIVGPGGVTASSYQATPTTYSPIQSGAQIEFLHSITTNWMAGNTRYYRHKVIIKNNSQKPISDLKLKIEDLSGPIWGLNPTGQKNTYQLPQWQKTLKAGQAYDFVYVQGGPQAKVSVLSYN